jgi:dTDP-4-amino-4,6-dideoxygalactose transaminase
MWSRIRLEIGFVDLGRLFFYTLMPGSGSVSQEKLESHWSEGTNDSMACLSVRSGFDLFLQVLDLPRGSEVLFSAVTVPDMPRIARLHGLIPVPVDVRKNSFEVDMDTLQACVTEKSRVLVIAHLLGSRPDMQEVLSFARKHGLIVVEDCAQAWFKRSWRGNEGADISLFSFGMIKTATCLGGALCRIENPELLAQMRSIQSRQKVQTKGRLLFRILKAFLLKLISLAPVFGVVAGTGKLLGKSVDDLFSNSTKGFPGADLAAQIRNQAQPGIYRMLLYRLQNYKVKRIDQRRRNADFLLKNLGPELVSETLWQANHSFWLFPYFTEHAEALIDRLRSGGFDSTRRGSMVVVSAEEGVDHNNCPNATRLLNQTVFLPCYGEMPQKAMDQMCTLIRSQNPKSIS